MSDDKAAKVEKIELKVKNIVGKTVKYKMDPTATVRKLKDKICSRDGIQVEQIRLVVAGKKLKDDQKLDKYKGKRISMVLAL